MLVLALVYAAVNITTEKAQAQAQACDTLERGEQYYCAGTPTNCMCAVEVCADEETGHVEPCESE